MFLVGTAFDFRTPTEFTAAEREFLRSQFSAITPENSRTSRSAALQAIIGVVKRATA